MCISPYLHVFGWQLVWVSFIEVMVVHGYTCRTKTVNTISMGRCLLWSITTLEKVNVNNSSVGRGSHRCRGGHGFESRWSPDIFQASSLQLLKLENLLHDHSSLSSTTAVQIWISYMFHTCIKCFVDWFPVDKQLTLVPFALWQKWQQNVKSFFDPTSLYWNNVIN